MHFSTPGPPEPGLSEMMPNLPQDAAQKYGRQSCPVKASLAEQFGVHILAISNRMDGACLVTWAGHASEGHCLPKRPHKALAMPTLHTLFLGMVVQVRDGRVKLMNSEHGSLRVKALTAAPPPTDNNASTSNR